MLGNEHFRTLRKIGSEFDESIPDDVIPVQDHHQSRSQSEAKNVSIATPPSVELRTRVFVEQREVTHEREGRGGSRGEV